MSKRNGLFLLLTLLPTILFSSGCANIVSGKSQAITFQSKPEVVDVYINGQKVGQTPLVTQVLRSKVTNVTFKQDGYEESTIQLQTKTNPWFYGNVLWSYFSTIGSTVDSATNAIVEYEPNMYFITLVSKGNNIPITGITDQNTKIARYVVINYKALGQDLSTESGEHLEALLLLLAVEQDKRKSAIEHLKELFVKSESAIAYAKEIEIEFASN